LGLIVCINKQERAMDIKEIREKKKELEDAICQLITDFKVETGIEIMNGYIQTDEPDMENGSNGYNITTVKIFLRV